MLAPSCVRALRPCQWQRQCAHGAVSFRRSWLEAARPRQSTLRSQARTPPVRLEGRRSHPHSGIPHPHPHNAYAPPLPPPVPVLYLHHPARLPQTQPPPVPRHSLIPHTPPPARHSLSPRAARVALAYAPTPPAPCSGLACSCAVCESVTSPVSRRASVAGGGDALGSEQHVHGRWDQRDRNATQKTSYDLLNCHRRNCHVDLNPTATTGASTRRPTEKPTE